MVRLIWTLSFLAVLWSFDIYASGPCVAGFCFGGNEPGAGSYGQFIKHHGRGWEVRGTHSVTNCYEVVERKEYLQIDSQKWGREYRIRTVFLSAKPSCKSNPPIVDGESLSAKGELRLGEGEARVSQRYGTPSEVRQEITARKYFIPTDLKADEKLGRNYFGDHAFVYNKPGELLSEEILLSNGKVSGIFVTDSE